MGLRDQIQGAVLSITNNIADGHVRRSYKAFKNFLFITIASAAEVQSMLLVARELGYMDATAQKQRFEQSEEAARRINGFIRMLNANI